MQKYKNFKHLVVWAGGRLTSLCAGSLCAGNQLLFVTNSTYLTAVLCRAEAGRGLTELTAPPLPGLKNPETLSVGEAGLVPGSANCPRLCFLPGRMEPEHLLILSFQ